MPHTHVRWVCLMLVFVLALAACEKDTGNDRKIRIPVVVNEISPLQGPAGAEVTLTGSGFGKTKEENVVKVGDMAAEVLAATSISIRIRIPVNSTGGRITVSAREMQAVSAAAFTIVP